MIRTFTIELSGGIGNQLFQIAFLYSMSTKLNTPYKLFYNQFAGCRQGSHPSKYYNNIFEKLKFEDDKIVQSYSIYNEKNWYFYPIIDDINKLVKISTEQSLVIKFTGSYQSENYFKEYSKEIKDLFTPQIGIINYLKKNTNILNNFPELIDDNDFCFIGVRRGDYVTYSHYHNPCGMVYFIKAMEKMNKNKYYIMSDDLKWIKDNFKGDKYVYLDIKDDLESFLTICLFKNYIISNSTFHWWGSYLSIYNNPRIIAPDKWLFGEHIEKEKYWSIYRDGMEIIERIIEV